MRFFRNLILIVASLFFYTGAGAQAVPFFRNYSPSDYGAMSQNWSLAQDSKGFIYVGNNSCLLRFNGKSWERFYPLGSEAIIRSLYADHESGRLYIGSFRAFGYVEYDEYGNMVYTSLHGPSEASAQDNEEIWYITRIGTQIFFIYFTSYYVYDTVSGTVHREVAPTSYFYHIGNSLILSSIGGQSRMYKGASPVYEDVSIPGIPDRTVKMFPGRGKAQLAVSATQGLYMVDGGSCRRIDSLKERWDVANRAIQCADSTVIVGFLSGGVFCFSVEGETLWHIGTEEGLQDGTVLSLLEDQGGNVWCALDKGVSVIFKGGDQWLSLASYHLGKISVSLLDGENLFVGSNHGLSHFSLDRNTLELEELSGHFPNTQLWSLYKNEDQVFIGENNGTYVLDLGKVRLLSTAPGGTSPRLITLHNGDEVLVQGSFTYLYIYKKEKGEWRYSHTVQGLMSPVRHLEVDYLGNIWLERMYEGVQCIRLSEEGLRIEQSDSYFENGVKLCKMGGRVLFHNMEGFWYFDDKAKTMSPFEPLNQLKLGDCRRIIPAGRERYWMVRQNDAVLLSFYNDTAILHDRVRFSDLGVSLTELFESIIPLSDDRFLFGMENGYLIHDVQEGVPTEDNLCFSAISVFDGEKTTQFPLNTKKLDLPHNASVGLSLLAPGDKYQNSEILYQMQPFDYGPQVMGPEMRANYVHMPSGTYRFTAFLADRPESELSLTIVVAPSFFASRFAVGLYLLSAICLCAFIYWILRQALKRQRIRLEHEKEKELLTIRKEQLEASLLLKSKELATYSLLEIGRNQVLEKLRTELSRIRYEKDGNLSKKDYDRLQSIIKDGEFSESSWEHFYTNFDLIHKSFFRTLQERHPDITTNDLRICAYLRLNLSTKELADVMGITPKGAEAAKYRLRKKLSLDSSTSISEYLSRIGFGENRPDNQ